MKLLCPSCLRLLARLLRVQHSAWGRFLGTRRQSREKPPGTRQPGARAGAPRMDPRPPTGRLRPVCYPEVKPRSLAL